MLMILDKLWIAWKFNLGAKLLAPCLVRPSLIRNTHKHKHKHRHLHQTQIKTTNTCARTCTHTHTQIQSHVCTP